MSSLSCTAITFQKDPNKHVMSVEKFGDLSKAQDGLPLMRYMKLSTLLMLLEGKAFFPSVSTLKQGDPLEGELCSEAPWLVGKLRKVQTKDEEENLDEWLLKNTALDWERTAQKSHDDNGRSNSDLFADLYVRELAKRRAVWCWFESQIESAGMWSIYGHQGVAVRTSLERLVCSLPKEGTFQIARILYASRDPASPHGVDPESIEGDKRIHRPHLVKGMEYLHEHEIRVVTPCERERRGTLVRGIDWHQLIDEIIISPLLPLHEAKAIEALIRKYHWPDGMNIRRSSILGKLAQEEEQSEALGQAIRETFCDHVPEPNLPSLLKEL
jgi:hypothetical protein